MKLIFKFILFCLSIIISNHLFAQANPIYGNPVSLTSRTGDTTTILLKTPTKNVIGQAWNAGNGRLEFRLPKDSFFVRNDSPFYRNSSGYTFYMESLARANAPLYFDYGFINDPVYDGNLTRHIRPDTTNVFATKNDLKDFAFTDSSGINYFVDTISSRPKCPDVSGNSYLIAESQPDSITCGSKIANPFKNRGNQIAINIGGVYNFYQPAVGQHLIVTNDNTSGEYRFASDSVWDEFPVSMHPFGDKLGAPLKPGTKDNKAVFIQVFKKLMAKFAPDSSFTVYGLANKTGKPVHIATDGNGKFFIVPDNDLTGVDPVKIDSASGAILLRKTFIDSIRNGLFSSGGSGAGVWGSITGTLSNQTDLQNALDAKFNISSFNTSFDTRFNLKTSDDVTEGSTNKYFTNARARSAISVLKAPLSYNNTTGVFDFDSSNWHSYNYYNTKYQPAGSYLTSYTELDPLALKIANNLSDLNSVSIARSNLGLGTLATLNTINNSNWSGSVLSVANGGTGTATPSLLAGNNISITGSFPSQTINTSAALNLDSIVISASGMPVSTSYSRLRLLNANAATSANQYRWSPALEFSGTRWNGTSADNAAWRIYLATDASNSGDLRFDYNGNNQMTLRSGSLVASGISTNSIGIIGSTNFTADGIWGPSSGTGFTLQRYVGLNGTGTTSINIVSITGIANTRTAGSNNHLAILPIYNQVSSTTANTDLLINRTETSIGSGTQRLASFQVGSVEKIGIDNKGNIQLYRPLATNGSTPSYSLGTGAGTAASASITGNDIGGYITINTGTAPTAGGNVITITFATALTNTPTSIQLRSCNDAGAINGGLVFPEQSSASTTSWVIKNISTTALPASTTLKFYYTITQ